MCVHERVGRRDTYSGAGRTPAGDGETVQDVLRQSGGVVELRSKVIKFLHYGDLVIPGGVEPRGENGLSVLIRDINIFT